MTVTKRPQLSVNTDSHRIRNLELELQGALRALITLIKRTGGEAIFTQAELEAAHEAVLISDRLPDGSVVLRAIERPSGN